MHSVSADQNQCTISLWDTADKTSLIDKHIVNAAHPDHVIRLSRADCVSHLQTGTLLEELSIMAFNVLLPQKAETGKLLEIRLQA